MKISKQQNTHYLFVGGVSPYMSESELKTILSKLGPISDITFRKRSKAPFYNLGYGILSTRSYRLYQELIKMHFYQIGECKLEFKEYKDPKEAIKQNTIDSVNFSLLLQGLAQDMTEEMISDAVLKAAPSVKFSNIILRKNYADGLLTGEAKVIFDQAYDVKKVRGVLPIHISFKDKSGKTRTSVLREKNPY
jgi:RNA recognition motif-containing protein